MEKAPSWNQIAEDVMGLLDRETDPSQIYTYQEEIKIIYCSDEAGNTALVSVDGASPAEGPYVMGPFNPNSN
jgi:hypothetical protein